MNLKGEKSSAKRLPQGQFAFLQYYPQNSRIGGEKVKKVKLYQEHRSASNLYDSNTKKKETYL